MVLFLACLVALLAALIFIMNAWTVYEGPSMISKLTAPSEVMNGLDEYRRLFAARDWIFKMRQSRILRHREQKVAEAERLVEQLEIRIGLEEKAREFASSYLVTDCNKVGSDAGGFFVLNVQDDSGNRVRAVSTCDLPVGSRVILESSVMYQAVPLSIESIEN